MFWKRALRYPSQTAKRNTGIPACAPSGFTTRCLNSEAQAFFRDSGVQLLWRTGRRPVFRYG